MGCLGPHRSPSEVCAHHLGGGKTAVCAVTGISDYNCQHSWRCGALVWFALVAWPWCNAPCAQMRNLNRHLFSSRWNFCTFHRFSHSLLCHCPIRYNSLNFIQCQTEEGSKNMQGIVCPLYWISMHIGLPYLLERFTIPGQRFTMHYYAFSKVHHTYPKVHHTQRPSSYTYRMSFNEI